jgi:hypothetical protein
MPLTHHRLHYIGSSAWSNRLTFKGSSNSHHTGFHYTRLIRKHGTIYTTRQTPILLYGRVAMFCSCTAFPTLDSLLANLAWREVKVDFKNTTPPRPPGQGGGASRPHFGSARPGLCATSSLHVILSVMTPDFRHNEDMYGFWSIWYFSIIRCSWNGKSTKLVELVSNKHLSSIS